MNEAPHPLTAAAVLAAAVGLAGWPWTSLTTVFVQHDASFQVVAMAHLQRWMLEGVPWWAAPLSHPLAEGTTQADWVLGQALLTLPVRWAGLEPWLLHNVAAMAGLWLTALAVMAVSRALSGPGWHTVRAGVLGGVGAAQLSHQVHVNLLHHELGVLGALAVAVGLRRAQPAWALAGGLAVGLSAHFGAYMGLHAGMLFAVVLLAGRSLRPSTWAALAGLGLGAATLWPVWSLHASIAPLVEPFSLAELEQGALDVVPDLSTRRFPLPAAAAELGLLVAAALGWRRASDRPGASTLLAAAGLAGVLALGPTLMVGGNATLPLPSRWLMELPGLSSLREPARWWTVASLCLAPLVAEATRGRGRWALVALVAWGLTLPPSSSRVTLDALSVHPVYRALDDIDQPGAFFDHLVHGASCDCQSVHTTRSVLFHHRALASPAATARRLPAVQQVQTVLRASLDQRGPAVDFGALGVAAVVLHPPLPPTPSGWQCEAVAGHLACAVPGVQALPVGPGARLGGDGAPVAVATEGKRAVRCGDQLLRSDRTSRLISALHPQRPAGRQLLFLPADCTPEGGELLRAAGSWQPWGGLAPGDAAPAVRATRLRRALDGW